MKNEYIKPQMEAIEIEVETVMMQGSFSDVVEGETCDTFDSMSGRGSWVNLWE